jgi:hypothetical protein
MSRGESDDSVSCCLCSSVSRERRPFSRPGLPSPGRGARHQLATLRLVGRRALCSGGRAAGRDRQSVPPSHWRARRARPPGRGRAVHDLQRLRQGERGLAFGRRRLDDHQPGEGGRGLYVAVPGGVRPGGGPHHLPGTGEADQVTGSGWVCEPGRACPSRPDGSRPCRRATSATASAAATPNAGPLPSSGPSVSSALLDVPASLLDATADNLHLRSRRRCGAVWVRVRLRALLPR